MNWPNHFLVAVLVVAKLAIVAPWVMPRTWCKFVLAPFAAPCAASILWLLYEQHLNSIATPGDPLIRIDLFIIAPLIALDWLSAVAVALSRRALARILHTRTVLVFEDRTERDFGECEPFSLPTGVLCADRPLTPNCFLSD